VPPPGWHRDHARKAIRAAVARRGQAPQRRSPRVPVVTYDQAIIDALRICRAVRDGPTGRRLAPAIPELVRALRAHRELDLTDEQAVALLGMSAATAASATRRRCRSPSVRICGSWPRRGARRGRTARHDPADHAQPDAAGGPRSLWDDSAEPHPGQQDPFLRGRAGRGAGGGHRTARLRGAHCRRRRSVLVVDVGPAVVARLPAATLSLVAAVVAGLGAVSFAVTLTRLAARSFRTLTHDRRAWLAVAVVVVLGLNCWIAVAVVSGWAGARTVLMQLAGLAGTAGLIGAALVWWSWAAARSRDPQDGADAADTPVALLLFAVPLLALLFALVPQEVALFSRHPSGLEFAGRIADFLTDVTLVRTTRGVVAIGLIGWSAVRARRHPGPVPGFLGLAGLVIGVQTLAAWWAVPEAVVLSPAHVQLIVTLAVLASGGVALARQRWPSTNRLLAALGLLLFVSLVLNNTFVADPFAVALGATGPVFLLFGLVWAFLTTGAHGQVSGAPGFGRSMVLLGYASLPLVVLAWRAATVQPDPIGGLAGQLGAQLLGRALVLAVVASWLPTVLPMRRFAGAPTHPHPPPLAGPPAAPPPPSWPRAGVTAAASPPVPDLEPPTVPIAL